MNKTLRYEWDAEVWQMCTVTDELVEIEHNHHPHASRMFRTMSQYPMVVEGFAYHPVIVRDVFDRHDQLLDRQWAYLVKGEDGKWTLPDNFIDGYFNACAKVPKYLKIELERAQK